MSAILFVMGEAVGDGSPTLLLPHIRDDRIYTFLYPALEILTDLVKALDEGEAVLGEEEGASELLISTPVPRTSNKVPPGGCPEKVAENWMEFEPILKGVEPIRPFLSRDVEGEGEQKAIVHPRLRPYRQPKAPLLHPVTQHIAPICNYVRTGVVLRLGARLKKPTARPMIQTKVRIVQALLQNTALHSYKRATTGGRNGRGGRHAKII